MEARYSDPYEQQLLAVFESCLEKNAKKLDENGLKLLCEKLELDDKLDELKLNLLNNNSSITFTDFRNCLLSILTTTAATTTTSSPSSSLSLSSTSKPTTMSKQMIEELFEKLDTDCDGFINLDEFLKLFDVNNKTINEQLLLSSSTTNDWYDKSLNNDKNIITIMGPEQNGLMRNNSVINLWKLAGVNKPSELLHDLGFTNTIINLDDLINVLNDELKLLKNEQINEPIQTHVNLLKSALILYQEELRTITIIIEQLTCERDKLRIDIIEANDRSNFLAHEIDDNHIKIEQTKQEQIKQLEIKHNELMKNIEQQYNNEREQYNTHIKTLQEQIKTIQNDEQLIRNKLAETIIDNHKIEIDIQSYIEQISKLKNSNNQLLLQVQVLTAEHDEAIENDDNDNEKMIELIERIKLLNDEITLLRDQNDELTSELELMKNKLNNNITTTATTTTIDIDDYIKSQSFDNIDKQIIISSTNENNTNYDDNNLNIITTIINDLNNILNNYESLIIDCNYRYKINNIIDKLNIFLNNDNNKIKKINKNDNDYEERTSESLRDLVLCKTDKTKLINNKRISTSDDMIYNFNNFDNKNNKFKCLRDYPPKKDNGNNSSNIKKSTDDDGDNKNIHLNDTSSINIDADDTDNKDDIIKDRDRLKLLLKEQENKYSLEKKLLQEQCQELETSLNSLRTEYYRLEDYWTDKLDEERKLFDKEQKLSDAHFAELMSKISEYEEFETNSGDKIKNDGRLSPIDENINLEQQYNDLQAEYDLYKNNHELLLIEKNNIIAKYIIKKKYDTDNDYCLLLKKKDKLIADIIELKKTYKNNNNIEELKLKIYSLEKKKKNLQICLKQHKQHSNNIFDKIYKQHNDEVNDLQLSLNNIQLNLQKQLSLNTIQLDKLTKSDMLIKELFIENSYLKSKIDKLDKKIHLLTNFNDESTSV
ncbi:protein PFC0760c [Aphidius gifuensis]|uniref:protein PFC0760c n=1 Tax=Aphidius gifuensis TaxID=684658 RepID=UPI001CDD1B5C|nr:protein PFC0760c [Aphidius gifuensis]